MAAGQALTVAALPYMRFYPADYLADAAHLTAQQHGIYLLLIFNYWQRGGPLPNDDKRLARIAKCSMRDWMRARPVISDFFTVVENHWRHGRIDSELSHVEAKSLKSKKAGQASAQRRFNGRPADVQPTDTDTDTLDKSNGGKPPENEKIDPVKQLFDLGISILVEAGTPERQARSLVGKYRKGKPDAEVLQALLDCRAQSISNPVEWLEKRLKGARFISATGYEYRGSLEDIRREAERRADWKTHWAADSAINEQKGAKANATN